MTNEDIDRQISERIMKWSLWPTDWFPSTNIAHAWQVVEKMTNDALWFRITAVHG